MPPQLDKTSVQVSTLGANGSLVVAGGFSGELVAKRMHTFRHDYASRTYAAGISSATARHRSSLLSIWVSICTVDIVGS